jgi:hypothetical protein
MKHRAAATVALSMLLGLSATAQAPRMKLSETLVFDMDSQPSSEGAGHAFRADRGSRKGQMIQVWTTSARPEAVANVTRGMKSSEYQLLSPSKAGPLPEVDVLGIHYIKVRPERREAFERFVDEKLHPAVGNLRPDLRLLYYKSSRGADAGNYITIFALTRESRDKYWPGGSDSDALRAAFKPMKALTPELSTYLVEGSYLADEKFAAAVFESREWTDFVLIPRQ